MDLGDAAAWVAAIVALVAMAVSSWQAYEARKARQAAQSQAVAAEQSLWAAEAQAGYAREQVEVMRAQLDHEMDARDQLDAPEFTLTEANRYRQGTMHPVVVTRTDDRAPVWVRASWRGMSMGQEAESEEPADETIVIGGVHLGAAGPVRMVRNSPFEIPVVVADPESTVTLEVGLEATEAEFESGRKPRLWRKHESIELRRPPRVWVF